MTGEAGHPAAGTAARAGFPEKAPQRQKPAASKTKKPFFTKNTPLPGEQAMQSLSPLFHFIPRKTGPYPPYY
jgi:hypothetical protein